LLRHVYGEDHVKYVRNITDIDDKINARGPKDFPGLPPLEAIAKVTDKTAGWFRDDMKALGALQPTKEPRATEFVPEMIAMIEALVAKGHAYAAEGHVLFSVDSYADYGALSGRSTDDMIAGARVEVAPYKKNPMDFVLWKPSDDATPGWESPWGRGRPGWHIECSAMSSKLLGDSFDIHGGGADLMFPHHENEIAQSCCAAPGAGFANVWMHNGMINVDGRKMSKSLGNFLTVADLRDQAPGEVLRLALLSTHYRGTLDWTAKLVDDSVKALRRWRSLIGLTVGEGSPHPEVVRALKDDLNTPRAIAELHQLALAGDVYTLKASANLLGLLTPELGDWARDPEIDDAAKGWLEMLLIKRREAREAKDFATADAIRKGLDEAGVVVIDQKDGPSEWRLGPDFDPGKLEALK
ncbi:MAG: cysteine--tRNA ligase, partial [Pseudomonadota bacterium]